MQLEYVPLLRVMRELYSIPRGHPPDFNGMKRFGEYLRTIFPADEAADQLLPLLAMNPMAKDHLNVLLDELLRIDADGIAANVAAEAAAKLTDAPGTFKAALIVADDLMGAGTNRYDYEFTLRFGPDDARLSTAPPKHPAWLKDFWVMGVLWSSEAPTEQAVREAVMTAVHRLRYVQRRGPARTLREMLAQEGRVMANASCSGPALEAEDLAYTREVITPYLDADCKRTCMECLFGDAAGRTLGFTPRGLSPWAGVALALHEARLAAPAQPIQLF